MYILEIPAWIAFQFCFTCIVVVESIVSQRNSASWCTSWFLEPDAEKFASPHFDSGWERPGVPGDARLCTCYNRCSPQVLQLSLRCHAMYHTVCSLLQATSMPICFQKRRLRDWAAQRAFLRFCVCTCPLGQLGTCILRPQLVSLDFELRLGCK